MLSSTTWPYGVTLRSPGGRSRARPVEVDAAHVERVLAERARDRVEDVLDRDRALRPAEAAERGVALRVGPARVAVDRDVGQPVGVVEVADRARHHRAREVGREAGARDHRQLGAEDPAVVVVADLVLVVEAVAPAGDQEVVVAVEAQLDRPAEPFAPRSRRRRRTAPTATPCRRSRRPCAGTRPARGATAGRGSARPGAASRSGAGSSSGRACRRPRAAPRTRSGPRDRTAPGRRPRACRRADAARRRSRRARRRARGASAAARSSSRRAPRPASGSAAAARSRSAAFAAAAARRAASRVSAITANTGWPR